VVCFLGIIPTDTKATEFPANGVRILPKCMSPLLMERKWISRAPSFIQEKRLR
jgi:hypothetical protein